jgi:hypothetical protein
MGLRAGLDYAKKRKILPLPGLEPRPLANQWERRKLKGDAVAREERGKAQFFCSLYNDAGSIPNSCTSVTVHYSLSFTHSTLYDLNY